MTWAGVWAFASYRRNVPLSDPVVAADWGISFRVPAGWKDMGQERDFFTEPARVFHDDFTDRVLRIRRLEVDTQTSADEVCRRILASYSLLIGIDLRKTSDLRPLAVGPWPGVGCEAGFETMQPIPMALRLLLAVAIRPGSAAQSEAVAVELQGQRPLEARDRVRWRAVVESVSPTVLHPRP